MIGCLHQRVRRSHNVEVSRKLVGLRMADNSLHASEYSLSYETESGSCVCFPETDGIQRIHKLPTHNQTIVGSRAPLQFQCINESLDGGGSIPFGPIVHQHIRAFDLVDGLLNEPHRLAPHLR